MHFAVSHRFKHSVQPSVCNLHIFDILSKEHVLLQKSIQILQKHMRDVLERAVLEFAFTYKLCYEDNTILRGKIGTLLAKITHAFA